MPRPILLLLLVGLLAACPAAPDADPPDASVGDAGSDGGVVDGGQDGGDGGAADAGPDGGDGGAADAGPDGGLDGGGPDAGDGGHSLRFFGKGGTYDDRIVFRLDDPATVVPGPPLDVGAGAFTLEFWMRARAADNPNGAIACGDNNRWIDGNIVVDRDRHSQMPAWGASLGDGRMSFGLGVPGQWATTICGQTNLLDEAWHHVALQRRASDGAMWILVDGRIDAQGVGPPGDASYPDDGVPLSVCPGGLCDYSDPFLVFGAEKHGYGGISYDGHLDEIRVSDVLRYSGSYPVPTGPFATDANTVGLFHLDEGSGDLVGDASAHPGGSTDGQRLFGGAPAGPVWSTESPF